MVYNNSIINFIMVKIMARSIIPMIGYTFSRLTVIEKSEIKKQGRISYKCKCLCGNEIIVTGKDLRNGHTKSCRCLAKESTIKRNFKHGHSKREKTSKTYHSWAHMIRRCTNKKSSNYKYYGARGISVCKEWFDFVNFLNDMGEKPKNTELDRIDNDGNYCKENCRWITHKNNCNNQRRSNLITYNDITLSISQWAEYIGISQPTLYKRIFYRNWPLDRALNYV